MAQIMAIVTANSLQMSPSALRVKQHKPVVHTCPYQIFPFSNRRPGDTSISASNNRTKSSSHLELHDFDDEEEDEKEDMVVIPFREMKRWFENKPKGFGDGKDYDTSLEETLWQEIQLSRKAQLANINKLKSGGSTQSNVMREKATGKATEQVPSGIPVRVENLPKKRNIHRDLKRAFKEFSGVNHISAAVSGSKKTRDPVCTGFALVYVESEEAAHRFVQAYSEKNIKFGKVEKRIRCAIKTPNSSSNSNFRESAKEKDVPSDADEILLDSEQESWSQVMNNESILHDGEEIEAGCEELNISKSKEGYNLKTGRDSDATKVVSSPAKSKRSGVISKKHKAPEKGSNLRVSGSARRLKIREKVVLNGVFSKYGKKSSSALPVQS
ncbi:hypothetical protein H6P81_002957 [Aristolochia fimbriata]|uniref:RRM domain-containing protein n=1 Tax=Aristolochia fimbriata TaxID=158543 RepID=A0AAV7FCX4_ARIFI|nr:hypothetical protein H6P81_002957 [Aristolochia fimbriata]